LSSTPRLKPSQLALFGLPEFAVYLAVIPMSLYLPFFYSRDLGLSLTDIGLLLMVARVSDVITDPLKSFEGKISKSLSNSQALMTLIYFSLL
jgi:Na+/melibiose symporter-like transporter